MNEPQPDVSIVIPAHNRGDLLPAAISSCRAAAAGLRAQVIVVDDASTEDLAAAVRPLGADFVRLEVNSGSSVARNEGLRRARGRWVKFLDSDDVLVPGALRREVTAGDRTGADIVVAGWCDTHLDPGGNDVVRASYEAPAFSSIPDDLLAGRAVPTGAALYAAGLAARTQWDPRLAKLNDWDYFVSAASAASRIETVQGPSYYWRQHAGPRITSGTSFVGNALEFYAILHKLETSLADRGLLTRARRERLAQYLYKELRGLYRFQRDERHAIVARILELDPAFVPRDEERSRLFRLLPRLLPLGWVLAGYGASRALADRLQSTRRGAA